MHDTTFFDASFVVLVGFIVFMGSALKFGYHKALRAIDDQIREVSATLEEAQTKLKIAEDRKAEEKQLEKQIAKEIASMKASAEKQITEMKKSTDAEIDLILQRKQTAADTTLDSMRANTILLLQETLTAQAIELVRETLRQSPPQTQEQFNDTALTELRDLLCKSGINRNGGTKNKAIA